jgi:hypothetical protein
MGTRKEMETALAKQLIAGAKEHLASVTSVTLAGGSFTPAQIEASLQTLIDLRTAVDDAKAATKAKIVAEAAQAPSLRSQMAAFVAYVRVSFSNSPDVLADFGLAPKKVPTPLTVGQKAEAVARRAATRTARHTMGSQQKKDVKGTVTTIVATPPSPATPPVASGPVATAPAGTSAATTPHV